MKKVILILAILFSGLIFSQNPSGTYSSGQYKMFTPVLGTVADSVAVWNGTDKKIKFLPKSTLLAGISFSGFVPYTGATSDLNMGSHDISGRKITAINGGEGVYLSEINSGDDSGIFSADANQIIASFNKTVDVYKYANEHITYDNINGELGLSVGGNSLYVTNDGIYTSAGNVITTQDNGYTMTTFGSGVININVGTRPIAGTQNISFPTNKTSGSYTVAMTSDIPTPTPQDLEGVTGIGKTTSHGIEINNTSFDAFKIWDPALNTDCVIGRNSMYLRTASACFMGMDTTTSTDPYLIFGTGSKSAKLRINASQPSTNVDISLPTTSGTLALTSALTGGTVTTVTGSAPIVITSTPTTTPNVTITDAVADNTTKGASTYLPADFNSSSGAISLDYTNGQSANTSTKGYLTSTDWNTFNGKQATLVSGTSIKTINSTSLLGSGNIAVEPVINATTSADYYRGDKTFATLNKTAVGLSNVNNTSDASKPVSTAQQTALDLKVNKSRYIYQGYTTVTGVTVPTIAFSVLIPANTYDSTDGFEIIVNILKSSTAGAVNYNLYHDTTANGTTNAIATGVNLSTTNRGSSFQRILNLSGGNAYSNLIANSALLTPFSSASASPAVTTYNPAVDQYLTLQISGLTVVSETSSVVLSIRPLK